MKLLSPGAFFGIKIRNTAQTTNQMLEAGVVNQVNLPLLIAIIMLTAAIPVNSECSDHAIIQSDVEVCERSLDGENSCKISTTAELTLMSLEHESCLWHANHRDAYLGLLFTTSYNNIIAELALEAVDIKAVALLQLQLKDTFDRLEAAQEAVSELLLQQEDDGKEYEEDFTDAEKYRERFLECSNSIDKLVEEIPLCAEQSAEVKRKF
ncbi:hypothetical protein JTE90_020881 [Oedothorax gibbosus]|uniref:Uncharacterized protein n=1 Tax=Oedothorax gibbosus TaxID=931172 RepID=A0AAV6USL5_9ARAC|nr:hypothetical protein JTE90_020881 [Oedothorax gibbosus]